jgi:MORN repeat
MTWNEGTVYLGNWTHDIQNGYGKLIYPDGSVKEGIYENNVLVKPYLNGYPQISKSPQINKDESKLNSSKDYS